MEVLHISCNMGTRDLPDHDMYALRPAALGLLGIHIRQIPRAHVTTYTCITKYNLNCCGFSDCPEFWFKSCFAMYGKL